MKIFSFNVNGIRAAMKKGFTEWFSMTSPDILCIQETKAGEEQMDKTLFDHMKYYHYWHSAEKKGYSGVGLVSKKEPESVSYGIGMPKYDKEGRILRADFSTFTVISIYIPSGTMGGIRQELKMDFLTDLRAYLKHLKKEQKHIIISGDFNICHKPIDINHPERHKKSSGFLPEERAWFDTVIEQDQWIDTFRVFHQEPGQYSWWSYRANAKGKNLGWRIDYHLITPSLLTKLLNAELHPEVNISDHCPVSIEIN